MKICVFAVVFTAITSTFIFAQTSSDYRRTEFFAGYSHGQVHDIPPYSPRVSSNGFEAAAVYNVSRYAGIKADVSGTYSNFEFTSQGAGGPIPFDNRLSTYNILGGVQLKDNATGPRIKPFVHALGGAGVRKLSINFDCSNAPGTACGTPGTLTDTGFAGVLGGGLDIRINDRFDFRAGQIDYNPIRVDGVTDHNMRFSIGLVFKK